MVVGVIFSQGLNLNMVHSPNAACLTMTNHCHVSIYRVPTRTGKPGKMGRHFPVREKSGNFDQTGKSQGKSHKILEKSGNFRQILFIIFSDI